MLLVVFLFSKIKKQKKAFILIKKNKIQNTNTNTKNKVNNIKQKTKTTNKKQQTTNKKHKLFIINYKLLMMMIDYCIHTTLTHNF